MTTIDIETHKGKTAHWASDFVYGNAFLQCDPSRAGRYVATDTTDDRPLGYLETKVQANGRVSLKRLDKGLDKLLTLRTIKC